MGQKYVFTEKTPLLAAKSEAVQTTAYLYFAAFLSAVGGFLFGYDTGVVSGALLQLREYFELDDLWQELVVSITIAGAWLFAVLAGKFNDIIGRKYTVILASALFTAGSGMMAFAEERWILFSGRFVVGFGVGLSSMTVPLYIAEVSPTQYRGRLVTVNQLFVTAGQFIAAVVDGIFSYDAIHGWRFMLGLAAVPAIFQLFGFMWMPESPRWLCGKGKHDEAYSVLRKLRGKNAEIEDEFESIKSTGNKLKVNNEGSIIGRIWADREIRKRLMVGCMLMVFQQIIAINTVMYYSATIIEMAGFRDQRLAIWLAAGVAFVNFAFSIVGVLFVEKMGRRKLTLSSLVGIAFSLCLLSLGFYLGNTNPPKTTIHDISFGPCSLNTNCRTCLDDGCAFTYNIGNGDAMCTAKNFTNILPNWSTETDMCPIAGHLGWLTFAGLALYLVFFAPGMGPMPWTVNSELYPLWCRSTCFSIATSFNWLFNLVISMTFLSLTRVLTQQGAFLMYAIFAMLGFVFFYFFQPETKGTSLEQMDDKKESPMP